MKIEQDIKLDFSDVLIRPKRSTLESRNDINLEREFKFPHSSQIWKGIPITVIMNGMELLLSHQTWIQ